MSHLAPETTLYPYGAAVDGPAVLELPTPCCAHCLMPIVGEVPSRVNLGDSSRTNGYLVLAAVHHGCELAAIRSAITRLAGGRS
jgi:hypothetical protein